MWACRFPEEYAVFWLDFFPGGEVKWLMAGGWWPVRSRDKRDMGKS
jgi:hypothetical protein